MSSRNGLDWTWRFPSIVESALQLKAQRFAIDDDLRELPLFERKSRLAKLLARRPEGIFVAPYEFGEIGPDLFRAACDMASRASSQNTASGATGQKPATGSRSRTGSTRRCTG